jgi:hypothetical protein
MKSISHEFFLSSIPKEALVCCVDVLGANQEERPSLGFFIKRRIPRSNLGWLAAVATSRQAATQPAREC